MKTKVEVNGYEIEIEEVDGRIMVKAVREDEDGEEEVVEEFTIETEGAQAQGEEGEFGDDDEVQGFGDFEGEEEGDFGQAQGEDFESEEGDEDEDEGQDEDEDEDEVKLESFQSFVNKRK